MEILKNKSMKTLISILLVIFSVFTFAQNPINTDSLYYISDISITYNDTSFTKNISDDGIYLGQLECYDPDGDDLIYWPKLSAPVNDVFFIEEDGSLYMYKEQFISNVINFHIWHWVFFYYCSDGEFEPVGMVRIVFNYNSD